MTRGSIFADLKFGQLNCLKEPSGCFVVQSTHVRMARVIWISAGEYFNSFWKYLWGELPENWRFSGQFGMDCFNMVADRAVGSDGTISIK